MTVKGRQWSSRRENCTGLTVCIERYSRDWLKMPSESAFYHEINNYNCRYDSHLGKRMSGL